ncbi:MAG: 16S rRNA (cytidine(1402)-2'-O)-methyltransferase [Pyrinomonadaceae bacterium]|nr:16S rRNA (cytidine(1402)-2'-O)-methyltransferase [Pyrinomonadaceae bacterium]MBA3572730.1 16S rRNA (cytidine(1402)-2'-O)-methyltransferase [Pyrinomonadaceae bacterium]
MAGKLYVVATPIGNLEDLTYRAARVLSEVDLIACEDTRHSQKLLNHYGIKTKTLSYHEHNERDRAGELLTSIRSGLSVALVSDAGTPGISDPGFRVVRMALEAGLRVVPIPGPTALVSALVASGLPSDEFFFAGFLPARSGARRARLADLAAIPSTLVFYEAPHRIVSSLEDARGILGEREAVVARELTKMHEEVLRGRLSELADKLSQAAQEPRGEMVVVIDRNVIASSDEDSKSGCSVASIVAGFEAEGLDGRSALKKSAKQLGISRDEAYRRLTAERSREKP